MSNDNVIAFQSSETAAPFSDALSELVRQGARQIIAQAVEAELKEFLAQYQTLKDDQGRQGVVRNGYLPERTIVTGVGEVEIQVPKVRDTGYAHARRPHRQWHQVQFIMVAPVS